MTLNTNQIHPSKRTLWWTKQCRKKLEQKIKEEGEGVCGASVFFHQEKITFYNFKILSLF